MQSALPFYLSIGMTRDEFWNGNPSLVYDYAEADMLKRKRRNEEMWLQGFYIQRAVMSAVGTLFRNTKKGQQPIEYEYDLVPLTDEDVMAKQKAAEKKRLEAAKKYFSRGRGLTHGGS